MEAVMSVSRRRVLLYGGIIGAGVIASTERGIVALAQAQPPLRRSLQGLAWNDPIVAAYRDAVGQMKQKPAGDKFNWVNLADLHGSIQGGFKYCPHGNWYFLPWHRAYTLMYERLVRQLTGERNFAMPYWDWTANPLMPAVFLDPTTPDGKTNWLYVSDPGRMRTWPPNMPMPPEVVGRSVLDSILRATPYETFGTSRPLGQNSLDPRWIVTRTGTQGILERNPHNTVHGNIGGWMPSAASPRDPIFFMHHGNIDRIWALWNSLGHPNSSESWWKDMPFHENFYNVDGSFYSPKVSDLFVPEALGYTYGLRAPAAVAALPNVLALNNKLTAFYSAAPNLISTGVKTFGATNTQKTSATPGRYLEIPVTVDATLINDVARRPPVSSGSELLDFSAALEQSASGTRALAFIRDVAATRPENTMYRVFLDCDYLSQNTPISDPHYVGTFGIFGPADHGGNHDGLPSFALDLTNSIQGTYGGTQATIGALRVQILPVPNRAGAEAGTATPTTIEVAFVAG
jgi:tyrosinase